MYIHSEGFGALYPSDILTNVGGRRDLERVGVMWNDFFLIRIIAMRKFLSLHFYFSLEIPINQYYSNLQNGDKLGERTVSLFEKVGDEICFMRMMECCYREFELVCELERNALTDIAMHGGLILTLTMSSKSTVS